MKIVLSQQEAQQIKNVSRMLGAEVSSDSCYFVTVTTDENGNKEIAVAEEFVSDIIGLVTTMAPVAKGVYAHVMSTFTLLRTLGEGLEAKWAKKPEQNKEVA
jgi:hypothetical protein